MAPRGANRHRRVGAEAQERVEKAGEGQSRMGARELRIRRDRAFETGLCKRRVGSRETVEMAEAEMIVCPGIQPVRVAQPRDARLVERYVGLEAETRCTKIRALRSPSSSTGATTRSAQRISRVLVSVTSTMTATAR